MILVIGLLLAAPASAGEDHLAAAKGIGEYLLETARKEGEGLRWAQYEGPGPAANESAPKEAPEQTDSNDGDDELLVTPGMNWFVLRVASNKEDSVRETLLRKIKIEGFEHLVKRILVPTEKEKTIKAGKQKIVEKKLYPGYVFVEMKLEDDGRIPQDVFFLSK